MAGTNVKIVKSAFRDFEREMDEVVYNRLFAWCEQILGLAIEFRERDRNAHNFTGNLLNSIVVILYTNTRNRRNTADFFFATEEVRPAIAPKMSSVTSRGGKRKNLYHFHPDYDQRDSKFRPTVPVNGRWGYEDATRFASNYKPSMNVPFTIVLAYTVEYAEFIEQQRHTAGYIKMLNSTKKAAIDFVGLQAA